MKPTLPRKLKEKLQETGMSVHALEKQAGLKRSAVQNILHGRSKKPSAEILYAITKVLGCSIPDLIGQKEPAFDSPSQTALSLPVPDFNPSKSEELFNGELYLCAVKYAVKILKIRDITLNQTKAMYFINEIYQYSNQNKKNTIDEAFASWLFEKLFSND